MRQAGRYMSEYRSLRERYSLLDLCRTPDLATEVTLQPVRKIDVDAAILFSDLLLPLEPMGIRFDFVEGEGPSVFEPLRSEADLAALKSIGEVELFLDQSEQLVPRLTQPWLFVIPGDDRSLPPDLQLAGARRFPKGRALWLNGEGHMVPQERPAEIARVIGDFVTGLPSAP